MQIWTAKQSYYDKAGVQILIMSDIFQIYTSHNDASSMSPCKGQDRLEIIIMSTMLSLHEINVPLTIIIYMENRKWMK